MFNLRETAMNMLYNNIKYNTKSSVKSSDYVKIVG